MIGEPPDDDGTDPVGRGGRDGGGRDGGAPDPSGPQRDPFDGLVFDESFIAAAPLSEPAAVERERAARERAERAAALRRRLEDAALRPSDEPFPEYQRYAPGGLLGVGEPPPPRHARRRWRIPKWVTIAAAVVLVGVFGAYLIDEYQTLADGGPERTPFDDTAPLPPEGSVPAMGSEEPTVEIVRPEDWPPNPPESADAPLGAPPPVPEGGGSHAFIREQADGSPVAYDPCRPIGFVIRPGGPPEGDQLIREAVAAVSAATGLQFVDEGVTDEPPSDDRRAYQPERYGDRWAPVLFTWSDESESPRLGAGQHGDPMSDPAGYAGSMAVGIDRGGEGPELVYVTGAVTLDRDDLGRMLEGVDGRNLVRAVIAHEVGHLVGLDHVDDPNQLMYPTIQTGVTAFQPGDLEGLAALGTGACFPEI